MIYLSPIVPRLLPQRLGFNPGLVPAGLLVEKITLGQVFLPVLHLPPFSLFVTWTVRQEDNSLIRYSYTEQVAPTQLENRTINHMWVYCVAICGSG